MSAILRKRRKSEVIEKSSKLFSSFIGNEEYKKASNVVFWCVLKDFGIEGIMNALDDANFFILIKKDEEY